MAPKPISACGKVREERKVDTGDRNSIAFQMAVDGTSSTPEYIEEIDRMVASSETKEVVAAAVSRAISASVGSQKKYTFEEFKNVLTNAVASVFEDAGFQASFAYNKAGIDSYIDCALSDGQATDSPPAVLEGQDLVEFNVIMAQIAEDEGGSRDISLVGEIDRVFLMARESVIKSFGIDLNNIGIDYLKALRVQPMDIEGDDEFIESPSSVHMNESSLEKELAGILNPESLTPNRQSGKCNCNGSCCGKNGSRLSGEDLQIQDDRS